MQEEALTHASMTFHVRILLLLLVLLAPGAAGRRDVAFLRPPDRAGIVSDAAGILLLSADRSVAPELLLSTQWTHEKLIPLQTKKEKDAFAREFYRLFDPSRTIESIVVTPQYFRGMGVPETLSYAYADTVGIRTLWQRPELTELVRRVQTGDAVAALISARGWRDTLLTTAFEDPAAAERALFKVPVRYLEGPNAIYAAPAGRKDAALRLDAILTRDHAPAADRTDRFHGSELEQGCVACHDGVPSATSDMGAGCVTCHTALTGGVVRHAPIEMQSCGSCHAWSAEQRTAVVEKSGAALCQDCHVETAAAAATSAVPHVVATECLTCHTPHNADRPRLLKAEVYDLCLSCHEQYAINHPVGRHPLRWATVTSTGAEISCVSCHLPHGSAYKGLLKADGGAMMSCLECHQR